MTDAASARQDSGPMQENQLRRSCLELMGLALVWLCFLSLYSRFQPQILAGDGFGWDGLHYAEMFKAFSGDTFTPAAFPFCNRIGTPWLAHLIGGNISSSFKLVNIIASAWFSIVIYFTCRSLRFQIYWSLLAFFLTLVPFFAPLRFSHYYPVYTDPVFLAALATSFFFLLRQRFVPAFVFLVACLPFREAAIYIIPVYAVMSFVSDKQVKKTLLLALSAFVAAILIRAAIVQGMSCDGSQAKTAIFWAWRYVSDPQRFVSVAAALSMTAAPLAFLGRLRVFNYEHKVSLIGLVSAIILSVLGGSDTTRIFYSFFPLYFVLIVSVVRQEGFLFSIFCALGYVVTNQFPRIIQEPLNYMPSRDESGLFWQFPDHARPEVGLLILSCWAIIFWFYQFLIKSGSVHQFTSFIRGRYSRWKRRG